MSRIYQAPPIVEAICELRFQPDQPWDWTIPGLLYAKIKDEFPQKKEEYAVPVQVRPEPREIAYSLGRSLAKMQFVREDGSAMVQVGPHLLAVNHLKPYPRWGAFKEMIAETFDVYREVAQPQGLLRIGLRYINRIEIPSERVRIEDYLGAVPVVPEELPQTFATWAQRVEIPMGDINGVLILQSGSLREADQSNVVFLLDLDLGTADVGELSLDDALAWIESAHDGIEAAFEACITDRARELFKEVGS